MIFIKASHLILDKKRTQRYPFKKPASSCRGVCLFSCRRALANNPAAKRAIMRMIVVFT